MKNILLFFLISFILIGCNSKIENNIYYLNKKDLQIIEFEDNKIFRYNFNDSTKKEMKLKDVAFYLQEDSLKLVANDTMVFKKINLNTKDNIDLQSSKYWTIRLEDNRQYWCTYSTFESINKDGKSYSHNVYTNYFYHPEYNDTTFSNSYNDSRKFKYFDKFQFQEIGHISELCLLSMINSDSISIIPVTSFNKNNNVKNLILEKYNSKKSTKLIGKWRLNNKSSCEYFDEKIGNSIEIKKDSIYFSFDQNSLLNAKYSLGLDSKFLILESSSLENTYLSIQEIKILSKKEDSLTFKIRYDHRACPTDTLTYKRINPER